MRKTCEDKDDGVAVTQTECEAGNSSLRLCTGRHYLFSNVQDLSTSKVRISKSQRLTRRPKRNIIRCNPRIINRTLDISLPTVSIRDTRPIRHITLRPLSDNLQRTCSILGARRRILVGAELDALVVSLRAVEGCDVALDVSDAGTGETATEGLRVEKTEGCGVSAWWDGSAGQSVADGEIGGDVDVLCAETGGELC